MKREELNKLKQIYEQMEELSMEIGILNIQKKHKIKPKKYVDDRIIYKIRELKRLSDEIHKRTLTKCELRCGTYFPKKCCVEFNSIACLSRLMRVIQNDPTLTPWD